MAQNKITQLQDTDKQNLASLIQHNHQPNPPQHLVVCYIQACDCSQHSSHFSNNYQPSVYSFYPGYCSTIQEVTEPTNTCSQIQITNQQSKGFVYMQKGFNYLNYMHRSGDCIAYHTRGKTKKN